ncbi:MAG: FkbM family methyltransferase [Nostoc sp. DedQUE12b]|uniref:FkbM family methyltransferase n=1 Tax=Nostoc sp. DedQUE12b TaxID=3075398 RepID=UPI002AD2F3E0|nr:FkbM family methyltransferase [Nostoc sp. DedQUE12b]MDZ8085571.1 FkbM family methyltransferase [Nostoc sp. DedQUE12b]
MQVTAIKSVVKDFVISIGLYRPIRNLYRFLNQKQLKNDFEYFQKEISFFSKLLDADSLCFDVGANIGKKSEAFLLVGARVVAFEPQPQCMRELKARCSHYGNKFHAVQNAVGAEPGEATLYTRERSGIASFHEDWISPVQSSIQVPITTLDRAIDEFGKPDYCKIDVEGWELEVLKGLTQPIPLLSFEYHIIEREINTTCACIDYLSNLGKILINVVPAEMHSFVFQEWLPPDEFLKRFPEDIVDLGKDDYGEIWVRSC